MIRLITILLVISLSACSEKIYNINMNDSRLHKAIFEKDRPDSLMAKLVKTYTLQFYEVNGIGSPLSAREYSQFIDFDPLSSGEIKYTLQLYMFDDKSALLYVYKTAADNYGDKVISKPMVFTGVDRKISYQGGSQSANCLHFYKKYVLSEGNGTDADLVNVCKKSEDDFRLFYTINEEAMVMERYQTEHSNRYNGSRSVNIDLTGLFKHHDKVIFLNLGYLAFSLEEENMIIDRLNKENDFEVKVYQPSSEYCNDNSRFCCTPASDGSGKIECLLKSSNGYFIYKKAQSCDECNTVAKSELLDLLEDLFPDKF